MYPTQSAIDRGCMHTLVVQFNTWGHLLISPGFPLWRRKDLYFAVGYYTGQIIMGGGNTRQFTHTDLFMISPPSPPTPPAIVQSAFPQTFRTRWRGVATGTTSVESPCPPGPEPGRSTAASRPKTGFPFRLHLRYPLRKRLTHRRRQQ